MGTKPKLALLFLMAISWSFIGGGRVHLPSYIPRCSLSDHRLCECLKEKANQVIPIISKGDVFYNIPSMFPISYAEAPIGGVCVKYVMYNAICSDWNTLVITDMFVDLRNRKFGFEGVIERIEVAAQNYTIIEGEMVGIRASGQGKSNTTLVGGKVKYNAHLRYYRKGSDVYLDCFDSTADLCVERAYFYFEDLQSAEESDVNAYLNENWEKFYAQVKPAFDDYTNAFVSYLLDPIINMVPFNKIFLP